MVKCGAKPKGPSRRELRQLWRDAATKTDTPPSERIHPHQVQELLFPFPKHPVTSKRLLPRTRKAGGRRKPIEVTDLLSPTKAKKIKDDFRRSRMGDVGTSPKPSSSASGEFMTLLAEFQNQFQANASRLQTYAGLIQEKSHSSIPQPSNAEEQSTARADQTESSFISNVTDCFDSSISTKSSDSSIIQSDLPEDPFLVNACEALRSPEEEVSLPVGSPQPYERRPYSHASLPAEILSIRKSPVISQCDITTDQECNIDLGLVQPPNTPESRLVTIDGHFMATEGSSKNIDQIRSANVVGQGNVQESSAVDGQLRTPQNPFSTNGAKAIDLKTMDRQGKTYSSARSYARTSNDYSVSSWFPRGILHAEGGKHLRILALDEDSGKHLADLKSNAMSTTLSYQKTGSKDTLSAATVYPRGLDSELSQIGSPHGHVVLNDSKKTIGFDASPLQPAQVESITKDTTVSSDSTAGALSLSTANRKIPSVSRSGALSNAIPSARYESPRQHEDYFFGSPHKTRGKQPWESNPLSTGFKSTSPMINVDCRSAISRPNSANHAVHVTPKTNTDDFASHSRVRHGDSGFADQIPPLYAFSPTRPEVPPGFNRTKRRPTLLRALNLEWLAAEESAVHDLEAGGNTRTVFVKNLDKEYGQDYHTAADAYRPERADSVLGKVKEFFASCRHTFFHRP